MMNFNPIDIFVKVFDDLFSYIGINHKFMCEVPSSTLNSTEEVNTLVGISGDMEGNIMFGYTDKTAKETAKYFYEKNFLNKTNFSSKENYEAALLYYRLL